MESHRSTTWANNCRDARWGFAKMRSQVHSAHYRRGHSSVLLGQMLPKCEGEAIYDRWLKYVGPRQPQDWHMDVSGLFTHLDQDHSRTTFANEYVMSDQVLTGVFVHP